MRDSRTLRTIAALLLVVGLFAACRTATGRTAGDVIDDATITAVVKSKLTADKASNLTRVNVDTTEGTVTLKGTVDTSDQKARAAELAQQTKGVKRVVNNLQVQPQPAAGTR